MLTLLAFAFAMVVSHAASVGSAQRITSRQSAAERNEGTIADLAVGTRAPSEGEPGPRLALGPDYCMFTHGDSAHSGFQPDQVEAAVAPAGIVGREDAVLPAAVVAVVGAGIHTIPWPDRALPSSSMRSPADKR